MTTIVAQLGARRHYSVPRELHARGMLECLVTDFCANAAPWRWLDRLFPGHALPNALRRVLERRAIGLPSDRIRQFPFYALVGIRGPQVGEARTVYWARRNAAFGRRVVEAGFGAADTVYAYNGAALEIFEAARRQGLRTILDQTAAPWRWNTRLLHEEAQRWPGWEEIPAEIDVSGRLSDREEAEWRLADRILCGSEFAAAAVGEIGGPTERCAIIPYPASALASEFAPTSRRLGRRAGPLRVLFAGTLQLRKGIQYLLEAKRRLRGGAIAIRLVGPSQLSPAAFHDLSRELEVTGAVPRSELAAHFAWADAFVLPTLSEGAANVCYEAMAAGLPVITTPNAGSIVRHREEGLIVPIRDSGALADAMELLAADDELRLKLGINAEAAVARTSVANYSTALVAAVGGSYGANGERQSSGLSSGGRLKEPR
jgi:glycosyltransferase involved in cell wall biosynthesis